MRPPPLRRRGAARDRAEELATGRAHPPVCARANDLRAMGFPVTGRRVGDWIVDHAVVGRAASTNDDGRANAGPPSTTSRRACRWRRCGSRSSCPPPSWCRAARRHRPRGRRRPGPPAGCRPAAARRQGGAHAGGVAGRRAVPRAGGRRARGARTSARRSSPQLSAPARLTRIADGVVLGRDAFERGRPTSSRRCRSRSPSPKPSAPWTPPGASRSRCWNNLMRGASRAEPTTARERWFDRG